MRIAKYVLLIIVFLMTSIGCGEKETVPDAATSMKKYKAVRILTDPANIPFVYGSGTTVQGFDVDIGNEIGKDLGLEVRWIKISGYDHLFELLKNGEGELIISTIAIDPERTKEFAFSHPYYDSGDTIAHRLDRTDIKDLTSLSGMKVGVQKGRHADAFVTEQPATRNITVQTFPTYDDALGALNRTEIDAVVADEPLLVYSIFQSYPNLTTIDKRLNQYQYAVVARKTDKDLMSQVNETLDRLKQAGELASLEEKHLTEIIKKAKDKRDEYQKEEALKKAPKAIQVNIVKTGGAFNMDRLDGFQLVLEGSSAKFQSSPILTEGNRGNARFPQPVPPGEYRLAMSIFQMTTNVKVPEIAKSSLVMYMRVGARGIEIDFK